MDSRLQRKKDGYESDGSLNHAEEGWDNKPMTSEKTKQDEMKLGMIDILRINQERQNQLWEAQQQREDERRLREIAREDERC